MSAPAAPIAHDAARALTDEIARLKAELSARQARTCATCRFWRISDWGLCGICDAAGGYGVDDVIFAENTCGRANVYTRPTFGCVLHQPKDDPSTTEPIPPSVGSADVSSEVEGVKTVCDKLLKSYLSRRPEERAKL